MGYFEGTPMATLALITVAAVVLFLCQTLPFVLPALHAWRRRGSFERPVLFVVTVAALSFGALMFLMLTVYLPYLLVETYLLPQMEFNGFRLPDWLYDTILFVQSWTWLAYPALVGILAVLLTRYVGHRWSRIVEALRV